MMSWLGCDGSIKCQERVKLSVTSSQSQEWSLQTVLFYIMGWTDCVSISAAAHHIPPVFCSIFGLSTSYSCRYWWCHDCSPVTKRKYQQRENVCHKIPEAQVESPHGFFCPSNTDGISFLWRYKPERSSRVSHLKAATRKSSRFCFIRELDHYFRTSFVLISSPVKQMICWWTNGLSSTCVLWDGHSVVKWSIVSSVVLLGKYYGMDTAWSVQWSRAVSLKALIQMRRPLCRPVSQVDWSTLLLLPYVDPAEAACGPLSALRRSLRNQAVMFLYRLCVVEQLWQTAPDSRVILGPLSSLILI